MKFIIALAYLSGSLYCVCLNAMFIVLKINLKKKNIIF